MDKFLTPNQQKLLKDIYYSPEKEGSYGGVEKLYHSVKKLDPSINKYKVSKFLDYQDVYSLHKQNRLRFKRRKVIVETMNEIFASDLIVMPDNYSKYNNSIKFLLVCIDIFSKYAWVLPLKSKKSQDVQSGLEKIFNERKPLRILTDAGSEYTSHSMETFFEDNEILHLISRNSETKSNYCERFIRGFKSRIFRYLTANTTYRYIDVLPKLVSSYNKSFHSSIKTFPANVTKENEQIIFENLYAKKDKTKLEDKEVKEKIKLLKKSQKIRFKFKVGQTVRVSHLRDKFYKGYKPNFSNEIFTIAKRIKTTPPTYKLVDSFGSPITGSFYTPELTIAYPQEDKIYKIEKILGKKKIGKKLHYLVKWEGFDKRFNSYVPAKEVKDLK